MQYTKQNHQNAFRQDMQRHVFTQMNFLFGPFIDLNKLRDVRKTTITLQIECISVYDAGPDRHTNAQVTYYSHMAQTNQPHLHTIVSGSGRKVPRQLLYPLRICASG